MGARGGAQVPVRGPLVFSDLDGTFLLTDKTVPARNLRALDALLEAGGAFVPCTGRFVRTIPAELLDHPATRFVAHTNGASVCEVVRDASSGRGRVGETLRVVRLDPDRVRAVAHALAGRDVLLDVFTDEGVMTSERDYDRLGEFVAEPNTLRLVRETRTPVDMPFDRIVGRWASHIERLTVFWRDAGDDEAVRRAVARVANLSCVSSMPCNFEISDSRATKGAALEWVCGTLGVDVRRSVAFGDSANDAPMLRAAGDGVAMANATPEALAAADHVTSANDECGVARYLEALLGR